MVRFVSRATLAVLLFSETGARFLKEHKAGKATKASKCKKNERTCNMNPESTQGSCEKGPDSMTIILNSCGDVVGPTVVNRAMEAAGHDISSNSNKTVFSEAWEYMATLDPTNVILAGDNVYNDGIANWGKNYHPYGYNMAQILTDASEPFMKFHGYLTDSGAAGPLYYSYLELLKDKLQDGYIDNDEFNCLREITDNSIHVTWDDHDYLTNDPANPHFLRHEFRKAEIETLSGWDKKYFRFGPAHKGIERSWTQELSDFHGNPFLVRFIVLDEETTHKSTQGCTYFYDPTSERGFTPRQTKNSSLACPDLDVLEDFEDDHPKRVFFGDDQLNWFREQLEKPADLIFVINGGPNFEVDYDYASLTEFPGEKRKFIELLRDTGAEHVIFMAGDSHASYVTKTPNIVGYPLYTIIGSGLTQGLSYDRYVSYWGDISHRFLVAAGSTNKNNRAATFAEVNVFFDEEGAVVRFTPHMRDGLEAGGWDTWYAQETPFTDEPWAAQYDIRVSDLEIDVNWPRYHYDTTIEHKFVPEVIYLLFSSTANEVSLKITNASGEIATFPLVEGNNCGEGNYGFCKDKWGAFTYATTKVGTYAPSKANQEICEHSGFVGDEISWAILEDGVEAVSGTTVLKIRNTVLYNSAGSLEDLHHFGTNEAYVPVGGSEVGVNVLDIINEPEMYGGFKVPVKGWNGSGFDDAAVQAAYESGDRVAIQAAYLAAYYPDIPQL